MIYKNIYTNKKYITLLRCKMKIGNDWIDAVMYMKICFNERPYLYVRSKQHFNYRFKRIL